MILASGSSAELSATPSKVARLASVEAGLAASVVFVEAGATSRLVSGAVCSSAAT